MTAARQPYIAHNRNAKTSSQPTMASVFAGLTLPELTSPSFVAFSTQGAWLSAVSHNDMSRLYCKGRRVPVRPALLSTRFAQAGHQARIFSKSPQGEPCREKILSLPRASSDGEPSLRMMVILGTTHGRAVRCNSSRLFKLLLCWIQVVEKVCSTRRQDSQASSSRLMCLLWY